METWADRVVELARVSVRVLHVVKVAGISGSENHLLLLLPALREHGFDVRSRDAPRGRAGRRGVRHAARRGRRPGRPRAHPGHRRPADARAPDADRPARAARHRPHAPRPCRLPRSRRSPARARPGAGQHEARVQPVPRRDVCSPSPTGRSARLADVHIAISSGLARYLADREGFDPATLRDRPLRHRAGTGARAASGCAAARDRRPADPDQGARRPPPGARSRPDAMLPGAHARGRR